MLHAPRRALLAALAAPAIAAPRLAGGVEPWPTRPITLLLPVPPGGPGDVLGRLLGPALTAEFGQPVVLDNRPGAGGTIGLDFAARSRADGHLLVIVSNSTYAIAPHLYPMPYDNAAAFAPVALLAGAPSFLCVHRDVPARSVTELVALLKAKPDSLAYATAGIGFTSHLATELFMAMTGTAMLHVPYRGGAPATQALLAGEAQLNFMEAALARAMVPGGLIRPLAVTSKARVPWMPEVPTLDEAGVAGFESATYWAMIAPAGVPQPVLDRVMGVVLRQFRESDMRDRVVAAGFIPLAEDAAAFTAHKAADTAKWGAVIRDRGIRIS
jgi:tripartite-type tricarboxylate transporter receptor subunit TctC